jgi:hypothetical protein
LTFQVKGASRSSDKALGLNQQRLSSRTPDTGGNGRALNPVPLTQDDHLFSFKVYHEILQLKLEYWNNGMME